MWPTKSTDSPIRLTFPSGQRIHLLFSVGFSLAAIILAETLLFTAAHTMPGAFGTEHLVAYSYIMLLFDLVFMFPVGISHTVAAQLSHTVGKSATSPDLTPLFMHLPGRSYLPCYPV